MSASSLSDAFVRDISKRYEDADDHDVIIVAGEEPDKLAFKAHSFILRSRSSFFNAALSTNWAKKGDNDEIKFSKPNITPNSFRLILKYMYTGSIELNIEDKHEYFDLVKAADELALIELVEYIQEHMIQNEKPWMLENFVQLFQKISTYESMHKLQTYCADLVCNDPSVVFKSVDFASLEEPSLLALLQRDDLVMDEIDIWEYIIRWGISKNPMIDTEVRNWSQQDFIDMEKSIRNCIPLVRFFQISATDYYYKVRPYKKLLPRTLKEDLQLYHILPNEQPKHTVILPPRMGLRLESSIITNQHASLIANWIYNKSKESYKSYEIPLNFKLLLRASTSKNGFSEEEFHKKCDNKGANIIVASIQNSKFIVGGYNPLGWTSADDWRQTPESFIFSFNKENKNSIISRVRNVPCAIRDTRSKRFLGWGCGDLHIFEGSCQRRDYEREIVGFHNFIIDDFEVFQVLDIIKKAK